MDAKFNDLTRLYQEIHPRLQKAERFRELKCAAFPFLIVGAIAVNGPFGLGLAFAAAAHAIYLLISELEIIRLKIQLDGIELQRSLHAK